jgi:hypothetical protein
MKTPSFANPPSEVRPPPAHPDPIEEAHALAERVDSLLATYAVDAASPELIRLRLARAYALGLRDELEHILGRTHELGT